MLKTRTEHGEICPPRLDRSLAARVSSGMATIREHVRRIAKMLAAAGADAPGLCARVLTARAAGLDEIAFLLAQNETLAREREARLYFAAGRVAGGAPLARVTGIREFYGRDFLVGRDALIPRPETELLVELALAELPRAGVVFADVGCGTGCIGLTLLLERPAWRGLLLDRSPAALAVAAQNASALGADCAFALGDLFHLPILPQSLDLLAANPPYVAMDEDVMPCVRHFDPPEAVFSENGGLAHLEALAACAKSLLRPGGVLLLEHGAGQGEAVAALLAGAGFGGVACHNDLAGRARCCLARKICI